MNKEEAIELLRALMDFANGKGIYADIFAIEEDDKREQLARRAWEMLEEQVGEFIMTNDKPIKEEVVE